MCECLLLHCPPLLCLKLCWSPQLWFWLLTPVQTGVKPASSEEQTRVILAHVGTEQLCKCFSFIRQRMQMDSLVPLGKPRGGRQCQPKVPR